MIYWKIDAGYNAAKHKSYFAVEAIGSFSAINYTVLVYLPTGVCLAVIEYYYTWLRKYRITTFAN